MLNTSKITLACSAGEGEEKKKRGCSPVTVSTLSSSLASPGAELLLKDGKIYTCIYKENQRTNGE